MQTRILGTTMPVLDCGPVRRSESSGGADSGLNHQDRKQQKPHPLGWGFNLNRTSNRAGPSRSTPAPNA